MHTANDLPPTSPSPDRSGHAPIPVVRLPALTAVPRRAAFIQLPERAWRAAIVFSFAVNLGLVVALLFLTLALFEIKRAIAQPLVGGLHASFVQMDSAHIVTTIRVQETIAVADNVTVHDIIQVDDVLPVVFDLPLVADTTVVLSRDTRIPRTTVYLNGLPVPTDIVLPAGTPLDIQLDLIVPVSQVVPVRLQVPVALEVPITLDVPVDLLVPVDIPLSETQLHEPFSSLVELFGPYEALLRRTPSSWRELLAPR
jgi:hypothetical protein